jgi:hypothetical protein
MGRAAVGCGRGAGQRSVNAAQALAHRGRGQRLAAFLPPRLHDAGSYAQEAPDADQSDARRCFCQIDESNQRVCGSDHEQGYGDDYERQEIFLPAGAYTDLVEKLLTDG